MNSDLVQIEYEYLLGDVFEIKVSVITKYKCC